MATARRGRPSRLAEEGRRARGRRRRRTERSRHRRSRTPAARRLRWHSARAYSTASRTRHHSRDRLRRRCVSGGRGRRPVVRVRSQQTQRDHGRCRLRPAVDEEAASAWHERHRWVTHGGGGGGNLSSSVGVEGDVRGGGRRASSLAAAPRPPPRRSPPPPRPQTPRAPSEPPRSRFHVLRPPPSAHRSGLRLQDSRVWPAMQYNAHIVAVRCGSLGQSPAACPKP